MLTFQYNHCHHGSRYKCQGYIIVTFSFRSLSLRTDYIIIAKFISRLLKNSFFFVPPPYMVRASSVTHVCLCIRPSTHPSVHLSVRPSVSPIPFLLTAQQLFKLGCSNLTQVCMPIRSCTRFTG